MNTIEMKHLTKDYGNQRGIFDVSFSVKKGEVMGFLGPNGAGKTTAIRHLLGFSTPDHGTCMINGMDCFHKAKDIHRSLGYLPGEIAFMDDMTGKQFLKFAADLKGMKNQGRMQELMDMFSLDPRGRIKKMSKGMKQKIGIVCAFMDSPDLYILDEPTSGLDPLMQNQFVELILEEKKRGATIICLRKWRGPVTARRSSEKERLLPWKTWGHSERASRKSLRSLWVRKRKQRQFPGRQTG